MSRSYKKNPMWRTSEDSKKGKRIANRKVRYCSDLPNGKSYKKVSDSYNIVDYKNLVTDWNGFTEHSSDTPLSQSKVREMIKELSTRYVNGEHDLRNDIKYLIDAIRK